MNHGAVLGYTPSPGPVTRSAFPALPMVCHELLQRNPPRCSLKYRPCRPNPSGRAILPPEDVRRPTISALWPAQPRESTPRRGVATVRLCYHDTMLDSRRTGTTSNWLIC